MTKTSSSRTRLGLQEKLDVIKYVKSGKSRQEAANKFKVSRPCVSKMMQQEDTIRASVLKLISKNGKMKMNLAVNHKCKLVENMLKKWHLRLEIDAPNINVTGEMLKKKALYFRDLVLDKYASSLNHTQITALRKFQASNGWLEKYKQRWGTHSVRPCGELNSTDTAGIQIRLQQIREYLDGVPCNQIFIMDESALQFRCTSSRSYLSKNNDGREVKRRKERITFSPIVSAAGEKLELQVIGKSSNPRALKGINIEQSFGFVYEHQSKAWQDGSSMLRLYHRFNRTARQRKCKLYLLLDSCSSHVWAAKLLDPNGSQNTFFEYGSIMIIFFPPNATSDCQPLDQGIIRSVKAAFRRSQLKTLLDEYELWQLSREESDAGIFPLHNNTHIRNAMIWLKNAWDGLTENTIKRCFAKSNVIPKDTEAELNEEVMRGKENDDESVNKLARMLGEVQMSKSLSELLYLNEGDILHNVNEILDLDKDVATGSDEINEAEIVSISLQESGISLPSLHENNEDDDLEIVHLETSEIIECIGKIRQYISLNADDLTLSSFATENNLAETLLEYEKRLVKYYAHQKRDR